MVGFKLMAFWAQFKAAQTFSETDPSPVEAFHLELIFYVESCQLVDAVWIGVMAQVQCVFFLDITCLVA